MVYSMLAIEERRRGTPWRGCVVEEGMRRIAEVTYYRWAGALPILAPVLAYLAYRDEPTHDRLDGRLLLGRTLTPQR